VYRRIAARCANGTEHERLACADRFVAALKLFKEAEQYAPASRSLIKVSEGVATRPVELDSSPSGATLYISDYTAAAGDELSEWERLGPTPLTVAQIPNWGYYRVRAVKPGYATTDAVLGGPNAPSIALPPAQQVPAGTGRSVARRLNTPGCNAGGSMSRFSTQSLIDFLHNGSEATGSRRALSRHPRSADPAHAAAGTESRPRHRQAYSTDL
jgi:hypothetical protein